MSYTIKPSFGITGPRGSGKTGLNGISATDILKTTSGPPPLTIRTSKPRTVKEITIYGNTVDGVGVGDRTCNLFNINTAPIGYNLGDTGCRYKNDGCIVSDYIEVKPITTYVWTYISNSYMWANVAAYDV